MPIDAFMLTLEGCVVLLAIVVGVGAVHWYVLRRRVRSLKRERVALHLELRDRKTACDALEKMKDAYQTAYMGFVEAFDDQRSEYVEVVGILDERAAQAAREMVARHEATYLMRTGAHQPDTVLRQPLVLRWTVRTSK